MKRLWLFLWKQQDIFPWRAWLDGIPGRLSDLESRANCETLHSVFQQVALPLTFSLILQIKGDTLFHFPPNEFGGNTSIVIFLLGGPHNTRKRPQTWGSLSDLLRGLELSLTVSCNKHCVPKKTTSVSWTAWRQHREKHSCWHTSCSVDQVQTYCSSFTLIWPLSLDVNTKAKKSAVERLEHCLFRLARRLICRSKIGSENRSN